MQTVHTLSGMQSSNKHICERYEALSNFLSRNLSLEVELEDTTDKMLVGCNSTSSLSPEQSKNGLYSVKCTSLRETCEKVTNPIGDTLLETGQSIMLLHKCEIDRYSSAVRAKLSHGDSRRSKISGVASDMSSVVENCKSIRGMISDETEIQIEVKRNSLEINSDKILLETEHASYSDFSTSLEAGINRLASILKTLDDQRESVSQRISSINSDSCTTFQQLKNQSSSLESLSQTLNVSLLHLRTASNELSDIEDTLYTVADARSTWDNKFENSEIEYSNRIAGLKSQQNAASELMLNFKILQSSLDGQMKSKTSMLLNSKDLKDKLCGTEVKLKNVTSALSKQADLCRTQHEHINSINNLKLQVRERMSRALLTEADNTAATENLSEQLQESNLQLGPVDQHLLGGRRLLQSANVHLREITSSIRIESALLRESSEEFIRLQKKLCQTSKYTEATITELTSISTLARSNIVRRGDLLSQFGKQFSTCITIRNSISSLQSELKKKRLFSSSLHDLLKGENSNLGTENIILGDKKVKTNFSSAGLQLKVRDYRDAICASNSHECRIKVLAGLSFSVRNIIECSASENSVKSDFCATKFNEKLSLMRTQRILESTLDSYKTRLTVDENSRFNFTSQRLASPYRLTPGRKMGLSNIRARVSQTRSAVEHLTSSRFDGCGLLTCPSSLPSKITKVQCPKNRLIALLQRQLALDVDIRELRVKRDSDEQRATLLQHRSMLSASPNPRTPSSRASFIGQQANLKDSSLDKEKRSSGFNSEKGTLNL